MRGAILFLANWFLIFVLYFPILAENKYADDIKQSYFYYQIQRNDTLYKISKKYNVNLDDLLEMNPQIDKLKIVTGQKIKIPKKKSEQSFYYSYYDNYYDEDENFPDSDNKMEEDEKKTVKFACPLKGSITNKFGLKNNVFINGIEILSYYDEKVKSAYYGKVVFAGLIKGYGKSIIIKHKDNIYTVYSSKNIEINVSEGDFVKKGETIATRKSSKNRINLFFQVYEGNNVKDPVSYLE